MQEKTKFKWNFNENTVLKGSLCLGQPAKTVRDYVLPLFRAHLGLMREALPYLTLPLMPRKSLQELFLLISPCPGHFPLFYPYISKYTWLRPIRTGIYFVSFLDKEGNGLKVLTHWNLNHCYVFPAIFFFGL